MNNYDWVLAGTRPTDDKTPLTEEQIKEMLEEAFLPDRTFQLFLCGAFVDRHGSLEELEEGLELIIKDADDYSPGDYCIVSKHTHGNLLFMPMKPEQTETLLNNIEKPTPEA